LDAVRRRRKKLRSEKIKELDAVIRMMKKFNGEKIKELDAVIRRTKKRVGCSHKNDEEKSWMQS
jgi:hypothetical protein